MPRIRRGWGFRDEHRDVVRLRAGKFERPLPPSGDRGRSLSLGWAVAFLAWMSAADRRSGPAADTEELPPIKPGAWASWARGPIPAGTDHEDTGHPCRMPDGRMGRVAAVLSDGEWILVCRAA